MKKAKIRDKKEIRKSIFKGLDEAAKTAVKISVISAQRTREIAYRRDSVQRSVYSVQER